MVRNAPVELLADWLDGAAVGGFELSCWLIDLMVLGDGAG